MDRYQINKRLFFWYAILWVLLFCALYLAYGVYFVDTMSTKSKWVGVFAGAVAILLGSCKMLEISLNRTKNPLIEKITKYFTNGSFVFIKRLFKITLTLAFLCSCFFVKLLSLKFTFCFLTGCIFTFLSIAFTTLATSKITTRSSQFYNESNLMALRQIFNSGIAISCFTMGLSIIPFVILFHITKDYQILNGFVFGSALVAILNNISTIATKQAVGCANEIVCSQLAEFSKNDRRNPLLLLHGVSKGILGVNIPSSELFLSFVLAIICAMTIGGEFLQLMGAFLPIIIAGSGIFACVIVSLLINACNLKNPLRTMFYGAFFANILLIIISYFLIRNWLPGLIEFTYSIAIGAFGGYFVCFIGSNFIFSKYKPIYNVANASISGFVHTFKQVIRESFGAVLFPALIIASCIVFSFLFSNGIEEPSMGLYGIMLAVLAMLCGMGIMIGIFSFGLISGNAHVVLDTYEEDVCEKQNVLLNSVGDVSFQMISLAKNFINATSLITCMAAVIAYSILTYMEEIDILNPYVMTSFFIGAALPFLYCGKIMGVVSKTTERLVFEVKKQIKRFPQILRYEMRPNYEKCVDVAAINTSIKIIFNTLLVTIFFVLIGYKLKTEALAGLVFGAMFASFGLIFVSNSSCVLIKSAKKYFETRYACAKNTDEYEAINVNESIFIAIKDLINPTLNVLVKYLAILALVFGPLFM